MVHELSTLAIPSAPWTEAVIYNFPATHGGFYGGTLAGVTLDEKGDVYGTSIWGGTGHCSDVSCGKLLPDRKTAYVGESEI